MTLAIESAVGDSATGDPFRSVMLAVVSRALEDLAIPRERAKAIRWASSEDFETVCRMAGLEVEDARRLLLEVAAGERAYNAPKRQIGRIKPPMEEDDDL